MSIASLEPADGKIMEAYKSEPGEDQVEELINHLHMDPKLAYKRMARPVYVRKMYG